tara:strand:+ start:67956 stop:68153 length:198 start_codon:yes stop_codon:yes gene_type:complete
LFLPVEVDVMKIDRTDYARNLGYQGQKRVIVQDGIVISHNNMEWHIFCASVTDHNREENKLPKSA